MKNAVAWWQNNDGDGYTIWYQNPYENGLSEDISVIPLYEGWEEVYQELQENLADNERIRCTEDGEFEVYEIENYQPPQPPMDEMEGSDQTIPEDVWSQIASAVKDGINSY